MPNSVMATILSLADSEIASSLRVLVDEAERAQNVFNGEVARIKSNKNLSEAGMSQAIADAKSKLESVSASVMQRIGQVSTRKEDSAHRQRRLAIQELRQTFGDYGAGEVIRQRLSIMNGSELTAEYKRAEAAESTWEAAAIRAHAITMLLERLSGGQEGRPGDVFALKELQPAATDEKNQLAFRTAMNIVSGIGGQSVASGRDSDSRHEVQSQTIVHRNF